jgi:prevent-host-death family protein
MRVGIRELKQNASSVIRRVANGESVEVTDRGRPVARIVPLQAADPYARMVADGEISVGNGRWGEIDPLPPLPGRSLSDALADLRADER